MKREPEVGWWLEDSEVRKYNVNDPKCGELGWVCVT